MAMAMMATAAMMMHLAFSQETLGQRRLSADLVSDDVASILQVSSAGFSASDSEPCEWKLSALGSNCIRPCAPMGMKCDPEQQKLLSGGGMVKVIQSLGRTCGPSPTNSLSRSAPFIEKGTNQCFPSSPISMSADSRCSASASRKHQRLCCCVPKDTSTTIASTSRFTTFTTVWPSSTTSTTSTNVGGGQGDPHIYTIWGDHYTLLKPGTFVAWNFSKGSVAWQLVACYSGARFTTQGLLLLDRSHRTMELTAEDCAWRDARHGGRPVRESEFLSHGASALEVTQVGKETEDFLSMESMIWLKMQSENGFRKVARLLVHCKPGDHMDFKVSMFDKSDMEHVGGELGATSDGKDHLSFFSSKLAVKTKTDDNFQAPGTWVGLGGSEAAAAYLNSKMQATAASLISTTCSEAEEQEAEKICGKHLQKDGNHPEIFGDCVFDICHGAGGEEVAQSAKAFIAA